ncbi:MAG: 50S ribosomal protein L11 methyltransferase, partial [Fuerstiella sp.]
MLNNLLRVLLIAAGLTGCGSGGKIGSSPPTLAATVESPEQPVTTLVAAAASKHVPSILAWERVESLPNQIAVFDHVFWEPDDTRSLRELLRTTDLVHNKSVLEIGTGSGIVSLCCLQAGANRIVATDINPWAVRNAAYNAEVLKVSDRMEVRMVAQERPQAWSVIGREERFDVILSNPPWELGSTTRVEDFALRWISATRGQHTWCCYAALRFTGRAKRVGSLFRAESEPMQILSIRKRLPTLCPQYVAHGMING